MNYFTIMRLKLVFTGFFVCALSWFSSTQAQAVLLKTMTLEVCECLNIVKPEDDSATTDSLMQFCFKAAMQEHLVDIKDSLGIDLKTPEGHSELGALFMYSMLNDCNQFGALMSKVTNRKDIQLPELMPIPEEECASLLQMSFNVVDDSTFLPEYAMVFTNNHLTEYTIDGTMTADYTITATRACAFDARVIFSVDKSLEELKTSNRAIAFEFVGKRNNRYYLMMTFFGVKHVFLLERD